MYKHILVPTDGSELSKKTVHQGIGRATALNAKVSAVTVSETFQIFAVEASMVTDTPAEYKKRIATLTARYLKAARDAATAAGVPCDVVQVEHEHPYEAIIDTARKKGCDATVMASHGRRGVSAVVVGSATMQGVTPRKKPVLGGCGERRRSAFPRSSSANRRHRARHAGDQ